MAVRFIEMFGGIGGFRLGLERLGWECVWYNDIDKNAVRIYNKNFEENWKPKDIRNVKIKEEIPDFDVLTAGFPCQPFSYSGKRLGFKDVRGTLFFWVAKVIKEKRPLVFILENVDGLITHDKGRTFRTMIRVLARSENRQTFLPFYKDNLGYNVFWKVLDSKEFGVPQQRKRVFIVGFREDVSGWEKFSFPSHSPQLVCIEDILEEKVSEKYKMKIDVPGSKDWKLYKSYDPSREPKEKVLEVVRVSEITGETPSGLSRQGDRVYSPKGVSPTLTTFEICVPKISVYWRRLTPRECFRLQGFPDSFDISGEKDRILYKAIGNAVTANVVFEIGRQIRKVIGNG